MTVVVLVLILVLVLVLMRAWVFWPRSRPLHVGWDLYVINLDRAPGRMVKFMRVLESTDLADNAPIRVSAVDGRRLDLSKHVTPQAMSEILTAERLGYRQRHYELTRGAVGCYLSHLEAWDRLLASDKDVAMVCEDDAVLDPDIGRQVEDAMASVPLDWDLLLMGYWCVSCDSAGRHWKRMHRFFGLHCYLIRRSAVQKVREYAGDSIGQQIDSMLSDMCSEGRLVVVGPDGKAARQAGTDSSVQLPLRAKPGIDAWQALPAVRAIRSLALA